MKFTVVTPLVRMEPGTGLRSYSIGDVIDGSDAEMKDLISAGFVKSMVAKVTVTKTEVAKDKETSK